MNGVAMARPGLILGKQSREPREGFYIPPAPPGCHFTQTNIKHAPKDWKYKKKQTFLYFCYGVGGMGGALFYYLR